MSNRQVGCGVEVDRVRTDRHDGVELRRQSAGGLLVDLLIDDPSHAVIHRHEATHREREGPGGWP